MIKRLKVHVILSFITIFTVWILCCHALAADQTENSFFASNHYQVIEELVGKQLPVKTVTIVRNDFLDLIKNPLAYSTNNFAYGSGELICGKKKVLLRYKLYDIADYEVYSKEQMINYYDLPDILSDKLNYVILEDCREGHLIKRSILLDNGRNILIIFKRDDNYFTIEKAIKFYDGFSISDIKVLYGFSNSRGDFAIITNSKNNDIYILNIDTLEVANIIKMGSWETLSGCPRWGERASAEWGHLIVYQINRKMNVIRKYDLLNNKVIYEKNVSALPIKGKILKVEANLLSLIHILTNFQNRYFIYQMNEEYFDDFWRADAFEDNIPFGKIKDIFFFNEGRSYYVAVFQVTGKFPVRLLSTTVGFKDLTGVERKIIRDISKWNHPTKAVFRKYGFQIIKVELINKTYPIFFVKHTSHKINEANFLKEIADKNGYWDYKIVDFLSQVDVYCDKRQRKITKVLFKDGK